MGLSINWIKMDITITQGFSGMVPSREEPLPILYIENLSTQYTTGTTLTLQPGSCRSDSNTADIILSSPVVNNNAVVGVNGLDVGAMANNTWYYLFVISDSEQQLVTASLLSLSPTNPTMPAGYDYKRRVAAVRNGVGAYFKFFQFFSANERFYYWDVENTIVNILTAGVAIVWTTLSCVVGMPPVTNNVYLATHFDAVANRYSRIRRNGTTFTNPVAYLYGSTDQVNSAAVWLDTDTNNQIQYRNDNAADNLTIDIIGFMDFLV